MTTNQDYVTLDAAALATITGGADGSVPICNAESPGEAARKVAEGHCTALVHTPGGVIALGTNGLNQAFRKKNALDELLAPPAL